MNLNNFEKCWKKKKFQKYLQIVLYSYTKIRTIQLQRNIQGKYDVTTARNAYNPCLGTIKIS
jgi:hypothetical protein